jgi:hypothetical protein
MGGVGGTHLMRGVGDGALSWYHSQVGWGPGGGGTMEACIPVEQPCPGHCMLGMVCRMLTQEEFLCDVSEPHDSHLWLMHVPPSSQRMFRVQPLTGLLMV